MTFVYKLIGTEIANPTANMIPTFFSGGPVGLASNTVNAGSASYTGANTPGGATMFRAIGSGTLSIINVASNGTTLTANLTLLSNVEYVFAKYSYDTVTAANANVVAIRSTGQ